MSNLEQTHNLNMKIRDALGNIPNTKVGDDWFTCDDFPNQEINNFALEFLFAVNDTEFQCERLTQNMRRLRDG